MKQPAIYIITNQHRTTTYTGVTSNLIRRIAQHRAGSFEGFAKRYGCKYLVYYEIYDDLENAILREKQIKSYRQEKKAALVYSSNPDWQDLWEEIIK